MLIDDGVLRREIRIAARPETVFGFFVEPEKMVRWKGLRATMDPRPGGVYRVHISKRDIAAGEYVEVQPYRRVVFTWGWEGGPMPPGASTVEVTLVPNGEGTLLRLEQPSLPDPEQYQRQGAGWDHYLPRLAAAGAGQDPGPDPWAG